MSYQVPLVCGDGIGAEISISLREIFEAAAVPIQWVELEVGQAALDKSDSLLPPSFLHSVQQYKYLIKGPLNTPVGRGVNDLNAWLKACFNVEYKVALFHTFPGISSHYQHFRFTLFNSLEEISSEQKALDFMRQAFAYARTNRHVKLSLVHQSDIEQEEAIFLIRSALKISKEYPDVLLQDLSLEQSCFLLAQKPEKFNLLVSSRKISGILTHLAQGITGSNALTAASNVGKEIIIFEPVHGTAGDIAGMGIANPVAMIKAGLLLLRHLQLTEKANKIEEALLKTLADSSFRTVDVNGTADTEKFTRHIIEQL